MAANKDEDTSSAGKTCIGVAIFSIVLLLVFDFIVLPLGLLSLTQLLATI
jgi:hypothetical protein